MHPNMLQKRQERSEKEGGFTFLKRDFPLNLPTVLNCRQVTNHHRKSKKDGWTLMVKIGLNGTGKLVDRIA